MLANELMVDTFERIKGDVRGAVEGLDEEQLAWRPGKDANSIAWLVWHLTRSIDSQISPIAEMNELWYDWRDKFDFRVDETETGYGMDSATVGEIKASSKQLLGYYDAVHRRAIDFVQILTEKDYAKIVDKNWDPPVTLAVRLVSIINEGAQHAGQAAYVRGLLEK